jgi:hypothetical protein|uniref:Uncharacterized protein n=1 Tax=viral metagenome TaxID=1070528 RepID=A0A6C0IWR4_9ZZZZ
MAQPVVIKEKWHFSGDRHPPKHECLMGICGHAKQTKRHKRHKCTKKCYYSGVCLQGRKTGKRHCDLPSKQKNYVLRQM